MPDLVRPSLEYTFDMNGEPFTVKMTYGLFNEVMTVVPNPEEIGELLLTNNGLRDYIIRRMITGNKRVAKEEDLIDPFDMDVDVRDLNKLVMWVGDHILYFFMTSAERTKELAERYQETIAQLAPSASGAAN